MWGFAVDHGFEGVDYFDAFVFCEVFDVGFAGHSYEEAFEAGWVFVPFEDVGLLVD